VSPAKNGRTDRDAVWDEDSDGPKEGGGADWRYLANIIEPSTCGGDAACCQITIWSSKSLFSVPSRNCRYDIGAKTSVDFTVTPEHFPCRDFNTTCEYRLERDLLK